MPQQRPLILVFDTDFEPSVSLSVLLKERYEVVRAWGAADAVSLLYQRLPILVIASVSAPEFDRSSFIAVLNELYRGKPVVILMTGHGDAHHLANFTRFRIEAIYRRPASLGPLLQCIDAEGRRLSMHVGRAVDYISQHYNEGLRVETIARAIQLSPSRLSHLFHMEINVSLKNYLTRVRVQAAKLWLRDTKLPLEDIAERVGFCDAGHLSRVFLRYVRRRPSRYRSEITRSA
jgi:AraC-like DNA-binding protein